MEISQIIGNPSRLVVSRQISPPWLPFVLMVIITEDFGTWMMYLDDVHDGNMT